MKYIDFKSLNINTYSLTAIRSSAMKIITNNFTVPIKYKTELVNSSVIRKSYLEENYGKI